MKKVVFFLLMAIAFSGCQKSISGHESDSSNLRGRGADDVTVAPPATLTSTVFSAFTIKYPIATRMKWELEIPGM